MFDLTHNAARIALIALMSTGPIAGLAQTSSPELAVDEDPDEEIVRGDETGESLEDTARSGQDDDADEDADVVEDVDGSLVEDDAKSDD